MITIRRATLADRNAISRVHIRSISELCKDSYSDQEIQVWTSRLKPDAYTKVIQRREFFVAERGGEIVGFGQLNIDKAEIDALYIAPEAVGTGVGRAILEQLETAAAARGVRVLKLLASMNAIGFYEHFGYARGGDCRLRLSNEVALACVEMRKEL